MNKNEKENYTYTFNQFMIETGNKISSEDMHNFLKKLHFYEVRLTNLNEQYCNGVVESEEYENKTAPIENKVKKIAESLELDVRFNSDPRGYAIRFLLPSKRYNTWDGETWAMAW